MANLPSHASPVLPPQSPPPSSASSQAANGCSLHPLNPVLPAAAANSKKRASPASSSTEHDTDVTTAVPASLLSPSFTPPATPGGTVNSSQLFQQSRQCSGNGATSAHVSAKRPKLLARLPKVECIVRARIPTTTGTEMFLHLYHNDLDNKEHLAIVFGNHIRSRSLDQVRPGETEMDRMIRGAYMGKLRPGRTSSWLDEGNSAESSKESPAPNDATSSSSPSQPASLQGSLSQAPLVRIHSECYTGETAWSARCDCGEQLDEAARLMHLPIETLSEVASEPGVSVPSNTSGGVIIYLRQEGRGIGLGEKLKAYNLQDLGSDTVEANLLLRHPADARSYGLATAMLADLGLGADANPHGVRLLTNNPDKVQAIEGPNQEVVVKERVAMIPLAWSSGGKTGINSSEVEGYLQTKVRLLGSSPARSRWLMFGSGVDCKDGPYDSIIDFYASTAYSVYFLFCFPFFTTSFCWRLAFSCNFVFFLHSSGEQETLSFAHALFLHIDEQH